MEQYTLEEAIKWNHLSAYDAVIQEELHELAIEEAKRKNKR